MDILSTTTRGRVREHTREGSRIRAAGKLARGAQVQIGKGLDIGTAFIYCAEKSGENVIYRTQRDAFFDVECSDFTKEMMGRCGVKYMQKGDRLYVLGEDAIQFANVFNRNTRRPLKGGVLSPAEADALPMVELIVKHVAAAPKTEKEILYYSLPAEPVDATFDLVYHDNIIGSFLRELGYTPKPLNEGLAVVFSELADRDFTGLGISFGGGMVNVCFANRSVPVFSFSVAKAGDWIDEQVARVTNTTASRVTAYKEERFTLDRSAREQSKVDRALSIYYRHLLEYVIAHIKRELEGPARLPDLHGPVTLALAGGTAKPAGFQPLFKELLKTAHFPLEVADVRLASQPLHSVAKGTLIAAIADEQRKGEGR